MKSYFLKMKIPPAPIFCTKLRNTDWIIFLLKMELSRKNERRQVIQICFIFHFFTTPPIFFHMNVWMWMEPVKEINLDLMNKVLITSWMTNESLQRGAINRQRKFKFVLVLPMYFFVWHFFGLSFSFILIYKRNCLEMWFIYL